MLLNALASLMSLFGLSGSVEAVKNSMAVAGQMNPEYIININAGAIIFFQVVVSYFVTKLKPFTTIFWGVMITVVSFSILIFGRIGWIVVGGIIVFSFGEMMTSPNQKMYRRGSPPDRVPTFCGIFFLVCCTWKCFWWSISQDNLCSICTGYAATGCYVVDIRNTGTGSSVTNFRI